MALSSADQCLVFWQFCIAGPTRETSKTRHESFLYPFPRPYLLENNLCFFLPPVRQQYLEQACKSLRSTACVPFLLLVATGYLLGVQIKNSHQRRFFWSDVIWFWLIFLPNFWRKIESKSSQNWMASLHRNHLRAQKQQVMSLNETCRLLRW